MGATTALGGDAIRPASRTPLEGVAGLWYTGWDPHWTRKRTNLTTSWVGAVMAAVGRCCDRLLPLRVLERKSLMARPGGSVRKGTVSGPVCDFRLGEASSNMVHAAVRVLVPDEFPRVGGRWRRQRAGGAIWRVPVQGPSDNRVDLARLRTLVG